ncbi:MAG: cupin [Hyphomicrobiaceae bacterium]
MTAAGTAESTKLIDNDRVTVWEWRFPKPGDNTGWHRHAYDYVIVPLSSGRLKVVTSEGSTIEEGQAGVPYFCEKGEEHDVLNASDGGYGFIEIELKP